MSQTGEAANDTPTQRCKHCKQQIDKGIFSTHSKQCLRDRKKRDRERQEAATISKDNDGDVKMDATTTDDPTSNTIGDQSPAPGETKTKSKKLSLLDTRDKEKEKAKKSVNGKKRKADDGTSAEVTKPPTKKQKKKEEAKAKAPKPKGPVDVEKQCGVLLPNGAMCARSLTCKSHAMGAKRAVPGRSMPYDMLLAQYQKKNQAKQQKAALASTAPLPDDLALDAPTGNVDSDEEKEAVMSGILRAAPRPLFLKPMMSVKSKNSYIRMKEMLASALGGSRGSGLFTTSNQMRAPNWPGNVHLSEGVDGEVDPSIRRASSVLNQQSRKNSIAAGTTGV